MRIKYITPKDIIPNYPKNSSPVVLWRDITSTPLSDKERIISDILTACYTFISERQTTNLKIALQNTLTSNLKATHSNVVFFLIK